MARKDEVFRDFLSHKIVKDKYNLDPKKIPNKVSEGLKSTIPLIKTIALIVDKLETTTVYTDSSLKNLILQNLNEMP